MIVNKGEEVFTACMFPRPEQEEIQFIADGQVQFDGH
ncbi:MAG: hypothetical protein M0Z65_05430 [Firmicutes bacterium]|nr:hypothetical protein [Bacillota bacterium]